MGAEQYTKPIPPDAVRIIMGLVAEFVEANPDTGCQLWSGRRTPKGYGSAKVGGELFLVHRAVWTAANGPIPFGKLVCHRCDMPPCVNLEHLFLGSISDNTKDAADKGRLPTVFRRGVEHPRLKLTDDDVRRIRTSPASARELGLLFGVKRDSIIQIRSGRRRGDVCP